MSANSEKLAQALNSLGFVSAVEHEQQASAVNVLCRLKPGSETLWAGIAEAVLREAIAKQGTPEHWHTHIARVYMIRNNKFVYGWTFVVMSQDLEKSIAVVSALLAKYSSQLNKSLGEYYPILIQETPQESDVPSNFRDEDEGLGEDDDYAEPDGPLARGAVPEADARGNPIVPRSARVHKIQMAGLPKGYDRNAPSEKNKGSWNIGSAKRKSFRPPVRT